MRLQEIDTKLKQFNYDTEKKINYNSILGNKNELKFEELLKSLSLCTEFLLFYEDYKLKNNVFQDFETLENKKQIEILILLIFVVKNFLNF